MISCSRILAIEHLRTWICNKGLSNCYCCPWKDQNLKNLQINIYSLKLNNSLLLTLFSSEDLGRPTQPLQSFWMCFSKTIPHRRTPSRLKTVDATEYLSSSSPPYWIIGFSSSPLCKGWKRSGSFWVLGMAGALSDLWRASNRLYLVLARHVEINPRTTKSFRERRKRRMIEGRLIETMFESEVDAKIDELISGKVVV